MEQKSDTPVIYGDNNSPTRSLRQAMANGIRKKCPDCGTGRLFSSFTRTRNSCDNCGLDFSAHRADDAPPYFTVLIAGHLVIPLALETKRHLDPPLALQFLIWGTLLGVLVWLLLPITKGALIGVQWANRMHGFGADGDETPEDRTLA